MAEEVCSKRKIAPASLFDSKDPAVWEEAYTTYMDPKYAKGKRGYKIKKPVRRFGTSTMSLDEQWDRIVQHGPPVYLIPRERGGPSFKDVALFDHTDNPVSSDDVYFGLISKGFGMGDLSSFTVGPIVGEGLCLVNAAFSKAISVAHVEGGGRVNLKRKNFWQRARKPKYQITDVDVYRGSMMVDGVGVDSHDWLITHQDEWFPEWQKWHDSVALCGSGDFHWTSGCPTIAYYKDKDACEDKGKFMNFLEWKCSTYLQYALAEIPKVKAFQDLKALHNEGIALGLVHPKARCAIVKPLSREWLRTFLFDPEEMCCMPYIVAYLLLSD